MTTRTKTIERLENLSAALAVGEPGDYLAVRESKDPKCRYEVYAMGYSLSMACRTARVAEQCIREHYRELRAQLSAGIATPICRIGR